LNNTHQILIKMNDIRLLSVQLFNIIELPVVKRPQFVRYWKMPEIESHHARAIGEKVRAVRQQQQISLRDLAGKADISASMLSQIETGKAFPSVRSIYSIAAALAVPVDYFFPDQIIGDAGADEPASSAVGVMTASELRDAKVNGAPERSALEFVPHAHSPTPVIHPAARPTIELKGGVTWSRLTALAEPNAEFLEVTYVSGATSGVKMSHHEGREFGLVLEGQLIVDLGFERYMLDAGDSIIFDSTTPHRLTNEGPHLARALWVVMS
jgi:transcriptional regulator with XRE-family HTH domain/mannose-6-phosphate isomerase-like protein (cupin superfamily)